MKNIVIYGAGYEFKALLSEMDEEKCNILAVLDKNVGKEWRTAKNSGKTISPDSIGDLDLKFDYVLICSLNYIDECYEKLIAIGIDEAKIVITNTKLRWLAPAIEAATHFHTGYYDRNLRILSELGINLPYRSFSVRDVAIGRDRILKHFELKAREEYVRISTLELIAWEIRDRGVVGDVAELGVYKGDFSKIINEVFADRKMWLFDTFEGFDKRDCELEEEYGTFEDVCSFGKETEFKDTDALLVLNRMKYKENVIIKKGYFPETTNDIHDDIKFAFVSIDADLFSPIYSGLVFFYERLSRGGYIMVHDYQPLRGARAAVRKFCEEHGVPYTPVSDVSGSVIISK